MKDPFNTTASLTYTSVVKSDRGSFTTCFGHLSVFKPQKLKLRPHSITFPFMTFTRSWELFPVDDGTDPIVTCGDTVTQGQK